MNLSSEAWDRSLAFGPAQPPIPWFGNFGALEELQDRHREAHTCPSCRYRETRRAGTICRWCRS